MEIASRAGRRITINREGGTPRPMMSPDQRPQVPAAEKQPRRAVRFLDALVTFSLMAVFFGLPLFFLGFTLQGLAFEKQVYFYFWLLIGLIAWSIKGVVLGEMRIRRTPLDLPLLIFWFTYLLATLFSVDKWHSFWGFFGDPSRGFMNITALILAFYLILSHFSLNRMLKLVGALLVSGFIVTLWVLLAMLNVKFLPLAVMKYAPVSPLGSVSGFGIFVAVLLPLAIMAIFKIGMKEWLGRIWKIIAFIFLGSMVVTDLLLLQALYNFVSFPILLAGLIIFLIYVLAMIVRPSGSLTWVPMAVFVAILVIMMIGPTQKSWLVKRSLPSEVAPPYSLSWQIAKGELKSGVGKFFLGSGPATYGYAYALHKPQEVNKDPLYSLRFYQGTGMIFEYLPTIGVLGVISFLLVVLTFISFSIYLLSRDKEKNKIYSLGILTASFIALLNILLSRSEGGILILGGLLMALAVATVLEEGEQERRALNLSLKASPKFALPMAFIFLMICVGAAFLFVYLGKVVAADVAMAKAGQGTITEASVNQAGEALRLYDKEGRYYTQIGQMMMVLANQEMLKGQDKRDVNKVLLYLNGAINSSRAGAERLGKDVAAVESLAYVYENSGLYIKDSIQQAEETYRKASELEPTNPNYPMKLGQIKEAQALGKEKDEEKKQLIGEARDLFRKSVELKANFAPGYYNLAMAEEALGNLDEAINNMSVAYQLKRNDINYVFSLARLLQARGKGSDNANAEMLFKDVLGMNSKEVNSHFYLALLYEKKEEKDKAIEEYKIVLDLIPETNIETRDKVQGMIDNLQQGANNVNQGDSPENQEEPQGE